MQLRDLIKSAVIQNLNSQQTTMLGLAMVLKLGIKKGLWTVDELREMTNETLEEHLGDLLPPKEEEQCTDSNHSTDTASCTI